MVFTHEEQSSRIFEVETVKKLHDPDATPLKRGVNEIEPSFSSVPCD